MKARRDDLFPARDVGSLDPALLKFAVDNAFDVVLVLDAKNLDENALPRIIYASAGVEQQTGFRPEELIGRSPNVFYGPKTDRGTIATLQHISRTLEPVSLEMINYRKDGSEFWAEVNSRPIVDRDGKTAFWITIRRDVTRRKFVEEALRGSEERYRLLFDSNPSPMWVADRATLRFLAVNDAAIQHYGYSRQQFLAMTVMDIRPSDDRDRLNARLSVIDWEPHSEIWKHRKSDGTLIDVSIDARNIVWLGRPARLVCATDITDKLRAESALRETAKTLELAMNQMPAILWTTDSSLRFTSTQGSVVAHFGLQPGGTNGRSLPEFFVGDPTAPALEAHRRALSGESVSYVQPYKDRVFQSHVEPLRDEAGNIVGVVGLGLDVTDARAADRMIKEWEERYRMVARATNDLVWDWNIDTDETVRSDSIERLFGYQQAEVEVSHAWWLEGIHPADRDRVQRGLRSAIDGSGSTWFADYRYRRKDGAYVDVHDRGYILRDERGRAVRMIGSMQDITERRRAQEALEKSERSLAAAQKIAHLGTWEFSPASHATTLSTEAYAICGLSQEVPLVDDAMWRLVHPDDIERVQAATERAGLEQKNFYLDHRIVRPDGSVRWVHTIGEFSRGNGEPRIFGTVMDITDRKLAEERAAHLTHYDALTELPNRVLLDDRLRQAVAHARRRDRHVAVLALDINRFKHVGETLGRAAADELLGAIAARLAGRLRSGDTLARVADNEFVVALADMAHSGDAVAVAQDYLESLAAPFVIGERELFVRAGMGISLFPEDDIDPDALIQKAESAMSEAKKLGESAFRLYTPAFQESALERLSLENELRRAIERKEFVVYYQPIVSIPDRAIVGVEALVRWEHPTRGLIAPAEFIPVAEETGEIVRLGELVLFEACNQIKEWERAGIRPPRVAVNISPRQFGEANFANSIAQMLKETHLKADMLELEITEGVVVKDVEAATRIFYDLKATGVRLALDDFGTGYSALGYLKRFPFDTIKIDRSFVSDIATDPFDEAIAASVVALGRTLDLVVTAEGVETEKQLAVIRDLRCQEAQGFLFSRPLPAADLFALLSSGKALFSSN